MGTYPASLPAAERRAATVASVVELAAVSNPSDITTTAIAERMGVTQGALFKHFPTKEAILLAVVTWVADTLLSRVDDAIATADSPLGALESLFLAHATFVAAHPGAPRLVFAELQRAKRSTAGRAVQALMQRYSDRVTTILGDARTAGQLDPALDIEAAAVLFVGTIQGLVMQSLLSGDIGRIGREAPRVFAIYRRGIAR